MPRLPCGAIAHRVYRGARFFDALHIGDHQRRQPGVEMLLQQHAVVPRDAVDRDRRRRRDRPRMRHGILQRDRRVFAVDQKPVETRPAERLGGIDRIEHRPDADQRTAALQRGAESVGGKAVWIWLGQDDLLV